MLESGIQMSWTAGLLWLVGIALVAFLVSWALSDLRPTRRTFYVPSLALVAGALTAGYLMWAGIGASFWTHHWPQGLIGAVLAGAFLTALLNRQRAADVEPRATTAATVGWDGLVYGAAEGLLLSVLPVLVTWQMLASNGWTTGWQTIGAGALSIAASVAVIVSHHLGYPDFRISRVKVGQAILGCGVLSIAYLFTGSVIAPILAHAALHVAIARNGMELPPHEAGNEPELSPVNQLAA